MRVWGNKLRSKHPAFCHLSCLKVIPTLSWDGWHLSLAFVHKVHYDFMMAGKQEHQWTQPVDGEELPELFFFITGPDSVFVW